MSHGALCLGLTGWVGEVQDAGGRLQQVRAAGWQVTRDGHDSDTVATLLGAHDAVILRLSQATVTARGKHKEKVEVKVQQQHRQKKKNFLDAVGKKTTKSE